MHKKLIPFEQMEWERPKAGVAQKVCSDGQNRIRLLRFEEDFVEDAWCEKGHVGYVLKGAMEIEFKGETLAYKAGDGLWIAAGLAAKHKVLIAKGGFVELVLFESETEG
jgi:quercetin dioxygenase-like cupin family protein